jgi:hypothetical protein
MNVPSTASAETTSLVTCSVREPNSRTGWEIYEGTEQWKMSGDIQL